MATINKILIANRGEIAVRIIRTCKSLGISTVAVYSRPDKTSPHVLLADDSVFIGEAASSDSYLNIDKILDAAKASGADAIHPGYGFLSENAAFAQRCSNEGIIFLGPSVEAIRVMGDKTEARKLMEKAGVPLPPGTTTALKSVQEAVETANSIGYPVLIKAAAGGGGKGMRIVYDEATIQEATRAAQSEAKNAFGDERVYVEKYLEEPRHIEVQIIADQHGNIRHLFDRECSIQRRHQKVVEEAPSPFLDDLMRDEITKTAVEVARACDYVGAGTVEFLADKHRNFYFLEMNTRLQVEHPVTELVTGVDLVELQIRVASGEKLGFDQDDVKLIGHAVECRICAEDPEEQFLPSTGIITRHDLPAGPGVRVDAGVRTGQEITIDYDPLMAKLVVHAENRAKALERMYDALSNYRISGLRTTISFCKFVMKHPSFTQGVYNTHFIKEHYSTDKSGSGDEFAALAGIIYFNKTGASSDRADSNGEQNQPQLTNWWTKRRQ